MPPIEGKTRLRRTAVGAYNLRRTHPTMTTLATAPAPASLDEILLFGSAVGTPGVVSTPALITAMLDSGKGISDLIFSPGRPLQVERHGELTSVPVPQLPVLQPEDT